MEPTRSKETIFTSFQIGRSFIISFEEKSISLMAKICKQKDQVWIENTVRAIHGKFTGFPFSWKCEICQVIGMLHSRKGKSKILPVTKEEFEKSCRRVGEEDFKNNKQ